MRGSTIEIERTNIGFSKKELDLLREVGLEKIKQYEQDIVKTERKLNVLREHKDLLLRVINSVNKGIENLEGK